MRHTLVGWGCLKAEIPFHRVDHVECCVGHGIVLYRILRCARNQLPDIQGRDVLRLLHLPKVANRV
jgi:hypothetical protein